MTDPPRILVAGIGNIFLGDDAFGVHVAQELTRRRFPEGVRVVDFGIRGIDLAYALLDGCDLAILIDAAPRGEAPGTLYVIEPEFSDAVVSQPVLMEGHSMSPAKVLAMVRLMRGEVGRVLIVGCEPAPIDAHDDMRMELTPAVRAAILPAAEMATSLIADFLKAPFSDEVAHAHDKIESPA